MPNHAKKDSTGICFIGERPFREFLARYLPREPGPDRHARGRGVGRHEGLMYYTLGQRQGLGIGGRRDGARAPWFVAGKDMARNALVVVQGHDHPLLYRREVDASDMHWIAGVAPTLPGRYAAKTRYRMPDAACTLRVIDDAPGAQDAREAKDAEDPRLRASFDAPQWAPTPGQYLVLYDGDVCLGGGVIEAQAARATAAGQDRRASPEQQQENENLTQ